MRRQLSPSFFPQNSMRKTGVIADDFTGAGDIASFLQKGGARTLLLTEIPASFREDYDCVVLALKSRSAAPEEAVRQVIAKRQGSFPLGTPWEAMEKVGFVEGWVLPFWDKIVAMIREDS